MEKKVLDLSKTIGRIQKTLDLCHETNECFDFADNNSDAYLEGYAQGEYDFKRVYLNPGQKAPAGRKVGTSKDGRNYYESVPRGRSAPARRVSKASPVPHYIGEGGGPIVKVNGKEMEIGGKDHKAMLDEGEARMGRVSNLESDPHVKDMFDTLMKETGGNVGKITPIEIMGKLAKANKSPKSTEQGMALINLIWKYLGLMDADGKIKV